MVHVCPSEAMFYGAGYAMADDRLLQMMLSPGSRDDGRLLGQVCVSPTGASQEDRSI
jgi:hypothetical protein